MAIAWLVLPAASSRSTCSSRVLSRGVALGGGVLPIERRLAGEVRCGAKLRESAAAPIPATMPSQGVERRSFRWSFRHTSLTTTSPYQLDDASNLTCKDGTERDLLDGREPTSNP